MLPRVPRKRTARKPVDIAELIGLQTQMPDTEAVMSEDLNFS
jgi:hypothetical protein